MDAFFDSETRPVFIEAKCHEILAKHVAILDATYKGLMDLFGFDGVMVKAFYDKRKKKPVDKLIVPLANFGFGQDVKDLHFDIKQFLCHLMGVACYCKRERKRGLRFPISSASRKALKTRSFRPPKARLPRFSLRPRSSVSQMRFTSHSTLSSPPIRISRRFAELKTTAGLSRYIRRATGAIPIFPRGRKQAFGSEGRLPD